MRVSPGKYRSAIDQIIQNVVSLKFVNTSGRWISYALFQ